jgi:hypothetical protein
MLEEESVTATEGSRTANDHQTSAGDPAATMNRSGDFERQIGRSGGVMK